MADSFSLLNIVTVLTLPWISDCTAISAVMQRLAQRIWPRDNKSDSSIALHELVCEHAGNQFNRQAMMKNMLCFAEPTEVEMAAAAAARAGPLCHWRCSHSSAAEPCAARGTGWVCCCVAGQCCCERAQSPKRGRHSSADGTTRTGARTAAAIEQPGGWCRYGWREYACR